MGLMKSAGEYQISARSRMRPRMEAFGMVLIDDWTSLQ